MFKVLTTLIALTLALGAQAEASFTFKEKEEEPEKPETSLDMTDRAVTLAQVGTGSPAERHSMGEDIGLQEAIQMIAPSSWKVRTQDSVKDKEITWDSSAGKPWIDSLEKVGKREGIRFVVNWKTEEIAAGEGKVKELASMTSESSESEEEAGPASMSQKVAKANEPEKTPGTGDGEGTDEDAEQEEPSDETSQTSEENEKAEATDEEPEVMTKGGKYVESPGKEDSQEKTEGPPPAEEQKEEPQKEDREETETEDGEAKEEKRDEQPVVVHEEKTRITQDFESLPVPHPKELDEGRLQESLTSWAEEWGYKAIVEGVDETESLSLDYPLHLGGEDFRKDLETIADDLNEGSPYKFTFNVYKSNNVLEITVSNK